MEKEVKNPRIEEAINWLTTEEASQFVQNPDAGISLEPPNFFQSYTDVAEVALGCALRKAQQTPLQHAFVNMVLEIEHCTKDEIGPETEGIMILQSLKHRLPLIRKLKLEKLVRNRISDKQREFAAKHGMYDYKHPAFRNPVTA